MRNLLVRAIVTGFGLRIGSELAKFVAQRVLPQDKDKKGGEDDEDDALRSTTSEPPEV
ncbi:hypothetical protein DB30_04803 [Enhygromyxa salina]|uniref:Uncharacterized protein n=1 Tax=Enhygromyxa salina TaxID=215803 RepID=A0A0C2CZ09_9BACT|nr:hypothetical protein [Enhygromyxa salina]KIG16191.1 hypothetical protein DB30_04803 [Enhygromyxa salina]